MMQQSAAAVLIALLLTACSAKKCEPPPIGQVVYSPSEEGEEQRLKEEWDKCRGENR